MNKQGLTIGRVVVLSLCFLLASPANLLAGPPPDDVVLFTYKGRAYTCEELTSVKYSEGLRHAEAAQALFDPEIHPRELASMMAPAIEEWPGAEGVPEMVGYYHHQLNSVIIAFVRNEMTESFRRRHPHAVASALKRFDMPLFDEYVHCLAGILQRGRDHNTKALLEAGGIEDFKKTIVFAYGPEIDEVSDATWQRMWRRNQRVRPYSLVNAWCLPHMKDGQVSEWYRLHVAGTFLATFISAEVALDEDKYREMAEDREYGIWDAFVIENVPDGQEEALLPLLAQLADAEGNVTRRGLRAANMRLSRMGAEARLRLASSTRPGLAEWAGVPAEDLQTRALVASARKEGPLRDYLYIYQEKPMPFLADDMSSRRAIRRVAAKELAAPLLREVLADMEVHEPFSAPTEGQLANIVDRAAGWETRPILGWPIPKFVKEPPTLGEAE